MKTLIQYGCLLGVLLFSLMFLDIIPYQGMSIGDSVYSTLRFILISGTILFGINAMLRNYPHFKYSFFKGIGYGWAIVCWAAVVRVAMSYIVSQISGTTISAAALSGFFIADLRSGIFISLFVPIFFLSSDEKSSKKKKTAPKQMEEDDLLDSHL